MEPRSRDLQANTLPGRFKSWLLPQGNRSVLYTSDFIWDFGKLPFPTHLGKYFIKIGKIRAKIHEIGKIKAIFGLGMTPIYGLKNGEIKSLYTKTHVTLMKRPS